MRAVQVDSFGGPEVMRVVEVPLAEPAEGQVQVRVHAAGVNPVDAYIRAGTYKVLPELPYIPGKDAAGVVTALGTGVSHLRVGQRVYVAGLASGAYAEALVGPAAAVHALAETLDFTQGAAVGVPYTTAYYALFCRALAKAGQTVLVHGATGAVGLAAVQFALAAGLTVLATGGSPGGRQLLADQGPVQVFDHHDSDRPGRIMDATGGRGVDVVLEMRADANLALDLENAGPWRPGGRDRQPGNYPDRPARRHAAQRRDPGHHDRACQRRADAGHPCGHRCGVGQRRAAARGGAHLSFGRGPGGPPRHPHGQGRRQAGAVDRRQRVSAEPS